MTKQAGSLGLKLFTEEGSALAAERPIPIHPKILKVHDQSISRALLHLLQLLASNSGPPLMHDGPKVCMELGGGRSTATIIKN